MQAGILVVEDRITEMNAKHKAFKEERQRLLACRTGITLAELALVLMGCSGVDKLKGILSDLEADMRAQGSLKAWLEVLANG